jgi:hypothetical protein
MKRAALILLAACGTTTTTTQVNVLPFPAYERRIEVFLTPPTRPHVDRDLIHVSAGFGASDDAALLGELRLRAQAANCDAVAVVAMLGRGSLESVLGSCIVYTDHSARTDRPAATAP